MKLIQTVTANGSTTSLSFTNIPQNFTDLVIYVSGRSSGAGVAVGCGFVFIDSVSIAGGAGDRKLESNGSSAYSQTFGTGSVPAAGASANTYGNLVMYLRNYRSTISKTFSIDSVTENNASESYVSLASANLGTSNAVTQINFTIFSGNLTSTSTASLYGITKGSDGIVTTS
jgi:hypothetical protein